MVTVEKSNKSEPDVKQGIDRKTGEARLAAIERMNQKMKGAGWRPLPKRGDVKKRIVKDILDTLEGYVRPSKNSCTASVYDESDFLTEAIGR